MSAETTDGRAARPFSLDDWIVEPELNRVSNGEVSVRIEPKTMEVLLCLADHAGEVVSRRDLVDTVWTVEFITESTLNHAVADLRKALADDARSPRFIETIPKRGYRLIARPGGDPHRDFPPSRSAARHGPLAVIIGQTVRLGDRNGADLSGHVLFLADQRIPVPGDVVVFGRGELADIRILDPEVSRFHARLECDSDRVAIEDLASKNGTLVNRTPITSRYELKPGDTIGIGLTTVTYRRLSDESTLTHD